jgi:hypothetical protein
MRSSSSSSPTTGPEHADISGQVVATAAAADVAPSSIDDIISKMKESECTAFVAGERPVKDPTSRLSW